MFAIGLPNTAAAQSGDGYKGAFEIKTKDCERAVQAFLTAKVTRRASAAPNRLAAGDPEELPSEFVAKRPALGGMVSPRLRMLSHGR